MLALWLFFSLVHGNVDWNFVKCGQYPKDAPGVATGSMGTCDGLLTEFVLHEPDADAANDHHRLSDADIDLKGWANYNLCPSNETLTTESIFPSTFTNTNEKFILSALPTEENPMTCRNYYSHGNTAELNENTKTNGYIAAGEECYESHRVFTCVSGVSRGSYQVCNVKAELTYQDSNNKVQTVYEDGSAIPKEVPFKTVACRSACQRFTGVCCKKGFIGRSSALPFLHGNAECIPEAELNGQSRYPMIYYDASWINSHINNCVDFPIAYYTETYKKNKGTVILKTRCYDPICNSKDTADSFCSPEQLISASDAQTSTPKGDSGANTNTMGWILMSSVALFWFW